MHGSQWLQELYEGQQMPLSFSGGAASLSEEPKLSQLGQVRKL